MYGNAQHRCYTVKINQVKKKYKIKKFEMIKNLCDLLTRTHDKIFLENYILQNVKVLYKKAVCNGINQV